ncbi:MAG: DUF3298 domain-containing protein [Brevundimonas sp.]|nr:DUF3298 domain-containing protein [Brevundimonas sp.]
MRMSAPVRLLLTAAALCGVLAACNRERAAEPGAPAPGAAAVVTPADAAAPLKFETKTPWAEVSLALPEGLKPQTDLHARLYSEEVRKLRQFVEGAQGERTEAGFDESMPPYAKTIEYAVAGQTGKLLSLKRVDYDWSGGAHPNTLTTGLLWDKALKREIGFSDLFRKGADLSVLDQALCSAVNAAKRARVPDSASLTLNGDDWACPHASATPFVLTPGSAPGKAAGLTFLIGPYQVGPYAEGAYELAIPATVFRSLLAPAYADEFGGQPTKVGDVTPGMDQSARN